MQPLIYFAPTEPGGLTKYAARQVLAMSKLHPDIVCLASECLIDELGDTVAEFEIVPLPSKTAAGNKLARAIAAISYYRRIISQLISVIKQQKSRHVVFTTYFEYLSPLWVNKLKQQCRHGVKFGVVTHDPIRDFAIGPRWWHQRSVSAAYSFVDVAFIHFDSGLDTGYPRRSIETVVIPHGPMDSLSPLPALPSRSELRNQYAIPEEADVLLAFGHIRDGKNLDLAIRALPEFENLHLLIAGTVQSSAQKPLGHYRELARRAGVASRCHWHERFIEDDEAAAMFCMSDLVLLTYSSEFKSASGVLNMAVTHRRPVIASAGDGPLKAAVCEYDLGVWIEPDSFNAVKAGLAQLSVSNVRTFEPDWERYVADNSWEQNAELVLRSMGVLQ